MMLPLAAFSQVDYLSLQDQLLSSCGGVDSTEIVTNLNFLDSLSKVEIVGGKNEFHYDLSKTYYKHFLKWQKKDDLLASIKHSEICWNQFENLKALWNLGNHYTLLNKCKEAIDYTNSFVDEAKVRDPEMIDYEMIYQRLKMCLE